MALPIFDGVFICHAWEAGKQAAEKLIAAHRQQHGRTPAKLAVSLWSVETMRHQGLLEAQALWLMGVEVCAPCACSALRKSLTDKKTAPGPLLEPFLPGWAARAILPPLLRPWPRPYPRPRCHR